MRFPTCKETETQLILPTDISPIHLTSNKSTTQILISHVKNPKTLKLCILVPELQMFISQTPTKHSIIQYLHSSTRGILDTFLAKNMNLSGLSFAHTVITFQKRIQKLWLKKGQIQSLNFNSLSFQAPILYAERKPNVTL